jgi:hypothetical protein
MSWHGNHLSRAAFLKMATFQSDLEDATGRLNDGLQRLRQQMDQVERLYRDGHSTETAVDLLKAMRTTVEELRVQLRHLTQAEHARD